MTDTWLTFLIIGCSVFAVAIVCLVLWRREIPPEPMEYEEPPPRVFTRIWDGNSTKEN
jgi:hypothetical protein